MGNFIIFFLKNFSNRFIIALFVPENYIKTDKSTMNTVLKNLGVVILLIGVGILMVPALTDTRDNMFLLIGLGTTILGFLLHIFLNKRFE